MLKSLLTATALTSLLLASPADAKGETDELTEMTVIWVENWRVTRDTPTDFETLRALYSDDTYSSFDFGPPAEGFQSFAPAWEYYQDLLTSPRVAHWQLELLSPPNVELRDDVGWSTATVSLDAEFQDGTKIDVPVARVTLIFEREEDGWKIVHEHGSVPLSLE